MPGEQFGVRVDECSRYVDGDGRFAETARDQFDFAGILSDVACRVDAGDVGFHLGVGDDAAVLHFESPAAHKFDIRIEAQAQNDFVHLETFGLLVRLLMMTASSTCPLGTSCSS